eukprot:NODE_283_length_1964_cov_83.212010_g236_i0.p2 GENE.NODE_283_length_1964_cov_83.212010_g236_i0~~NODE_283_length_1964_cov_83.212010_g236_i0.p2  ORF type:complete len:111 (-),score=18.94 NODE_283_length_1964_cov_83.212010_g236_i0:59-391(-)
MEGYRASREIPRCTHCSGFLRPCTVLFGETLHPSKLAQARRWAEECDLMIVMGSSLLVAPANKIPEIAIECRIPVALLNQGHTHLDRLVDILLNEQPCGEVCEKLMGSVP